MAMTSVSVTFLFCKTLTPSKYCLILGSKSLTTRNMNSIFAQSMLMPSETVQLSSKVFNLQSSAKFIQICYQLSDFK